MATTQRATRIAREERITALLLDMLSITEVLALLLPPEDHKKLIAILDQIADLKRSAIERRNTT